MAVQLGLNLFGLHGLPALLPSFIAEWSLSESEAGWLAGIPYLFSLIAIIVSIGSDRFDARNLVIAGSIANAIGFLGFAMLADGFWSALVFRAAQGIGFGWIYMPGATVIADRVSRSEAPGATAFYISTFPIVASSSFIWVDWLTGLFGWRTAFCSPGVTALVAALLVWRLVSPRRVSGRGGASLDLRPVLLNIRVMLLVLANFCHSVELLALRGWMVALFVFATTTSPGAPDWNWPLLAALLTLIGAPMSMIGSWLGGRVGMALVSSVSLLLSGFAACVTGFAADWPFWLFFFGPVLLHNLFILMDSGTLGGGVVQAVDPAFRGRAMAVYAFGNATGAFVGPVLFGIVLEAAGGAGSITGWGAAFVAIGLVAFLGAAAAATVALRR